MAKNGNEHEEFTELVSEISEITHIPSSSLLVNIDWLDLVDRYDEDKAWEIVSQLKDLLG
jgi:hypothetical protein